jgi:PilZ domain
MKRRIGDRRSKPRFEIVGDLWGSLDTTASMVVQNLGRGGALLESTQPLASESIHWVTALAEGEPHLVQIRVRHSSSAPTREGPPRFLIGVQFLKLSPGLEEAIVRHIGLTNGNASVEA